MAPLWLVVAVVSAWAPARPVRRGAIAPVRAGGGGGGGGGGEPTGPVSHERRMRRNVAPMSHATRMSRLRKRRVLETHHLGFLEGGNATSTSAAVERLEAVEAAAKHGYSELWGAGASAGERLAAGFRDLAQWAGWIVRANAMGLTETIDMSAAVRERLARTADVAAGRDRGYAAPRAAADADADAALADDWSAIHVSRAPRDFYDDDDDDDGGGGGGDDDDDDALLASLLAATGGADDDLVADTVAPDDWARIRASASEIDTQVLYDTVAKGRWVVKDGKTTFVRDAIPPEPLDAGDVDD